MRRNELWFVPMMWIIVALMVAAWVILDDDVDSPPTSDTSAGSNLGLSLPETKAPGQERQYPYNFEGLVGVAVAVPESVVPGGKAEVELTVTNASKRPTGRTDVRLWLLQTIGGDDQQVPSLVLEYNPSVLKVSDGKHHIEWFAGILLPGQSKIFRLVVLVPDEIPRATSQLCYLGYVQMSNELPDPNEESWTARSKRACSEVNHATPAPAH